MRMILTDGANVIHEFVVMNSFSEVADAILIEHNGSYFVRDHKVFGEDAFVFVRQAVFSM